MHYIKRVIRERFTYCIYLLVFITILSVELGAQKPVKLRSTLSMGASSKVHGATIQQSIGQSSVIDSYQSNRYLLRQGFLQPLQLSGEHKTRKISNFQAKIYPNPFSTGVRVTFSDHISGNVCCILYNSHGKIVYSKTFPAAQELDIDFRSINSGMYFISIKNNNQQLSQKLIKK